MSFSSIDKPSKYFNTVLYTGDGNTARAVTGASFQPDFVWIKERTGTYGHQLHDRVRGASAGALFSNETGAEASVYPLTSFDSDGFTTGSSTQNRNGYNLASWLWKANGAGVSNTSGTISSTVSANTTSGFSIVSYTANQASTATIGHGLGVAPSMIIVKERSGTADWQVYHKSIGNDGNLKLNTTNAKLTGITWRSTSPTSTVFTVGEDGGDYQVNYPSGATYIAYCFAEVKGFSKAFSYTGNGSADGTFCYLGFKPAFIMLKRSDAVSTYWFMFDNKRAGYNPSNADLYPNTSDAESAADRIDLLSNGFKCRNTSPNFNASGGTFVGIAFAENPFVSSKGIPTCAR